MSLSSEEIEALVEELRGLEGSRVVSVRQRDVHTVVLVLRTPEREKAPLLFSTRPRAGRFHLTAAPLPAAGRGAFAATARGYLRGARLLGVRQVSGDRIVEMRFRRRPRRSEGAHGSAGLPSREREPSEVRLVLEVRGGRGHLVLIDERRVILGTLHAIRRPSGPLYPGDAYRFPEARPTPPQLKALGASPWRHLSAEELKSDARSRPLHRAVERRYERLESELDFAEKKAALGASLRRDRKRLAATVEKVRRDLEDARGGEELRRQGELLKGAYGRLRRGMSSIELEDYFDPSCRRIRIPLEPALGPQENVGLYFRRYRKCARAVPFLTERLAKLEGDLNRVEESLRHLESCHAPEALSALEAGRRTPPRRPRAPRRGLSVTPASGPRRFLSTEGFEILVGRSAKGNDQLTLRIGRGNDTFLHVAGKPGAHVLIRHLPGKTVPLETILEAAQLALYYSLPERSRGAAEGAWAEVDYAPLKHVRKPKGLKPGQVLLTTRKTVRVRLDLELMDRIRRSSEGA